MVKWVFFICSGISIIIIILASSIVLTNDPILPPSPVQKNKVPEKELKSRLPSVSVEQIFAEDHTWTATISAEEKITLIATGDILPARSVNFQTVTRNDFRWPYTKTAHIFSDADITFINLETPLLAHCPVTQVGMIFCGDSRNIEGLTYIGTDVANLANNHTTNWQKRGVEETVSLLTNKNITVTGINGPAYKEIKGITFAFLGYNDISKGPEGISDVLEEKIVSEIAVARKQADIVIVQYHWGEEYRSQPDERQKYLGHLTIDAGADLVVGNHPHWIQPIEMYKGKLITYAHGNYIFDQMWSEETKKGVIGKYIFSGGELVDVEYFPIYIKDYGLATIPDEMVSKQILSDMKYQSEVLEASVRQN